jgi:hypothetical protein
MHRMRRVLSAAKHGPAWGVGDRRVPCPGPQNTRALAHQNQLQTFLRHFLTGNFNVRSRNSMRSLVLLWCWEAGKKQKQEETPWLKQIRASTPAVWPASKRAAWPPLLLWGSTWRSHSFSSRPRCCGCLPKISNRRRAITRRASRPLATSSRNSRRRVSKNNSGQFQ